MTLFADTIFLPKVCIVIPCTDRSTGFKECIQSACSQNYAGDLELLVIENNSKDKNTISSILSNFSVNTLRHVYLLGDSVNANHARNFAVKITDADYIFYLDSDDFIQDEHVALSMECLLNKVRASEKSICALYSTYILENGISSKVVNSYSINSGCPYDFLFGMKLGRAQTSTYLVHRNIVEDIYWNESLKRNQDYDFFIRVQLKYGWLFKEKPTTHVVWEKNVKRSIDSSSYHLFMDSHFQYMKAHHIAYYLYQLLYIYIGHSEKEYSIIRNKIKPYSKFLPWHRRIYALNYRVAIVFHKFKLLLSR